MTTPLFPPEVAIALFVSILAGLLAVYVIVATGGEHECGNRYCPHARRTDEDHALRRRG